ncbi:MAG TPA: hypothetical protein VMF66_09240 [Candidatus Acidoferrum sp.]|nr:hypothetical protein [Candidatus Acidoferrum sp.]
MKIDRSRLPEDVQQANSSVLDREENELLVNWRNPAYRRAIAAHEAAHYYYRRQAGSIRFFLLPPRFVYDPVTKVIRLALASINSEWPPSVTSHAVEVVARWSAAGAIWEQELCPGVTDADESAALDKIGFAEDIRKTNPHLTDEELKMVWTWAEEEVRKDFKNEAIRASILKIAEELDRFLVEFLAN